MAIETVAGRTELEARQALAGERRGIRALLPFMGPAFIASVAYVDPGNFATNIQGGAQFGYRLLWVVLFANLTAMLYQRLAAKLGIVTGRNLAEMCREQFPRPVVIGMWIVSEVAAMATDLAEFLGASLAIYLLFHVPLLVAALVTGLVTYLLLTLERFGFRPIERVIGAMVGLIALSYVAELVFSRPNLPAFLEGTFVPSLQGPSSVLLAVGIIGATVMPHALFIHSGLTQRRIVPKDVAEARQIVRFETVDVVIALSLAGLVNMAMLAMAAAVFHPAHSAVADITTAYRTLTPLLGSAAAFVFLISLLASGISSSAVGTMAGQVVMQGFVGFSIPVWVRRVVTMLPAILIIAWGVNPTQTLVLSQVVLSLVLPVPVIALVMFTRRRDIMGELANSRLVNTLATGSAFLILGLNLVLLASVFGAPSLLHL
ncbi:MAG: divalent metal cation transporter [Chloroflexi bacterium]|nr:MAG: divalent metal cation transporter [Chloroflexota bacterium]TME17963.1 MAG: divalent metal cation transporter [Chloroflexota bacterium]